MSLEIGQPEAVDVDLLDDAMDNQQSIPDDVEMDEGAEDEDMKMLDDGDEENNNNDHEMEEVAVDDGDEPLLEEDIESRQVSELPGDEKEEKEQQPPKDENGPEIVEVFDTEEGEGDIEEQTGVVEEPSSGVDRGTLESENEHVQVLSGNEQDDNNNVESLEATDPVEEEKEAVSGKQQDPEVVEVDADHQETDSGGHSTKEVLGDTSVGVADTREQEEGVQQQESAQKPVEQLEDESATEEAFGVETTNDNEQAETEAAATVNEEDHVDDSQPGDGDQVAVATAEEEEEGTLQLDFPIIVFRKDALYYLFDNDSTTLTDEPLEGLLNDTSHAETSIEALFSTLREVFDAKGDPLKIESELVFSFPQLGLILSEVSANLSLTSLDQSLNSLTQYCSF